jgi:hypothetical protein
MSEIRLDGASSSAVLDRDAQTLTFEHRGSLVTHGQKALSPLVIPLGAIESVECKRGRSTHWFWVVLRGREPWRDGTWSDPCGVVSSEDPLGFVELVRAAVAEATPADDVVVEVPSAPARSWRSRLVRGGLRAVVDGMFGSR